MQRVPTKRPRTVGAFIKRLRSRAAAVKTPATMAGLALTAVTVGLLLSSLEKTAQSRPAHVVAVKPASKTSLKTANLKPAAEATPATRRSVSFYTGDVRAGMFSEPVAPAPPAPAVTSNQIEPAPVSPFDNWNYTGSAKVGDTQYFVVENRVTHETDLLMVGDRFQGSTVKDGDGTFVNFKDPDGAPKSLMMTMNTSYTPLTATASYLTVKPQDQNGQQNQMQLAMQMMMQSMAGNQGANGASITLPNGTVLSGNQMQRYQNRLNRGWNGGGGGPGGGGGGRGGRRGGGGFGGG